MADKLHTDLRATTILLDALAALGLLEKRDCRYSVPPDLRGWLAEDSPETVLPMLRHAMAILRGWSQLAWVAKSGIPAPRIPSIRGPEADRASFIAAMHVVSGPMADELVEKLGPPQFHRLLDVGGASGTWTLAFLRAVPGATATIFDLPDAIMQARQRLAGTEFADRVTLVAGDFYADELPARSRLRLAQRDLPPAFAAAQPRIVCQGLSALVPGGRIALRDVVMEPHRTAPREGALFAVNMLVNTDNGGTFTFDEYAEDLRSAGFVNPQLQVKHEAMNSVVAAERP